MNPLIKQKKKEKNKHKDIPCIEHNWIVLGFECKSAMDKNGNPFIWNKKTVQYCKRCNALRRKEKEGWVIFDEGDLKEKK